ncbi:MAG TPA: class I SAM-dependent methyltransferase [Bryobacteraceae bacterium]|nr:class I SAM-dependent methyltransferase [Bryobacteraceae bacterium]
MDRNSEELAAIVTELRQRVRARNPNGAAIGDVVLPDLNPLLHARDAAEAKVASIGTVNPRAPGLLNFIVQRVKRLVARALDWHVREQVEFNRALMGCVQSTLEALSESNRAMVALSSECNRIMEARASENIRATEAYANETNRYMAGLSTRIDELAQWSSGVHDAISARIDRVAHSSTELLAEAQQLKDIRAHWAQWRVDWEQKLANNEIHFLRSIAEQQAAYQHRLTLMDAEYRQTTKAQHADFTAASKQAAEEIQQRLWADMADVQKRLWEDMQRIRADYETIIHSELRILRQRASLARATGKTPATPATPEFQRIDWLKFAEKFRGSEAAVQERQRLYAGRFHGAANVLDLGCGRGELLEAFRTAGVPAHGIDLNDDAIALCHQKELAVEKADLFPYLRALADSSLTGVACCQVVEHLPPESLADLIRLLHDKMRTGALLAVETPNPECLAIFATHFYLDPTHRHPIPSALLAFYLEEAGFGQIEVERLSPAVDSMPSLAELPEKFRHEFFGNLDYAIFARKLV